ncbi:N-acetyltransferase family protein [Streptomyces sp. cg36]|uniref:GNAT family N-acetyltransferase n=1 Tax=Streptomyces sp. cg36 TaxID=3238798 RepID=UPI0034E19DF4
MTAVPPHPEKPLVRLMEERDGEETARLYQELAAASPETHDPAVAEDEGWFFNDRASVDDDWAGFVVDLGDGRLAAMAIGRDTGEHGVVEAMVTGAEWRGQGWGRRVLRALLGWLYDRGVDSVLVEAEAGSEPFYAALGFAPCPGFEPGQEMQLDLNALPCDRH